MRQLAPTNGELTVNPTISREAASGKRQAAESMPEPRCDQVRTKTDPTTRIGRDNTGAKPDD